MSTSCVFFSSSKAMNEDRGQDVVVVPFYEAELQFHRLCSCACCSKRGVPGSPSASGASRHWCSCAKPSSPPISGYSVGMSPAGSLPSGEGCWGAWAGLTCSWSSGTGAQGRAMGTALGACKAPGPSMGEGGLGAQAAQKGHPVWHEGNVPCAWWTSSTEWVPQSSCDRRLRLIEKPSFPTQTPLDSDSLSGEDNKRRRGCREPQQCMSVLAEPGCASVVLWGGGWGSGHEKRRLHFWGQSSFLVLASLSGSGQLPMFVCPGETAHYCREICAALALLGCISECFVSFVWKYELCPQLPQWLASSIINKCLCFPHGVQVQVNLYFLSTICSTFLARLKCFLM